MIEYIYKIDELPCYYQVLTLDESGVITLRMVWEWDGYINNNPKSKHYNSYCQIINSYPIHLN